MVDKQLLAFGKSLKLHKTAENVFGVHGGFLISGTQSPSGTAPVTKWISVAMPANIGLSGSELASLADAVKSETSAVEVTADESSLVLSYHQKWKSVKAAVLEEDLGAAMRRLRRVGVVGDIEKGEERRYPYDVNGAGALLTRREAARIESELTSGNVKHADESSYLRGFVGALIGTIPGILLYVLAYYFGYLAYATALVIGAGAYFAYDKFGGRHGTVRSVITSLVVMLACAVAAMLGLIVSLMEYVSFGEAVAYFREDPEIRAAWYPDLAISMFVGLVLVAVLWFSSRSGDGYIREAEPA